MATMSLAAQNLFHVNGLVAVITGGGSGPFPDLPEIIHTDTNKPVGIGLMMAKALALNGAHKVYIIGRRKDVLEKAAASVPTENIIPLVGDVTSKESLASIVSTITSEVGYINVLIANSGILGPVGTSLTAIPTIAEFQKSFGEMSFEDYNDTFRVNVVAVWFTVVAFLGLLDEGNKKGNVFQKSQVITTSSIAGFNRMSASSFAYGQTKAAATHLAKQLASGLVPYGIRSNAIAPGCEFCFSSLQTLQDCGAWEQ
jgi:NAD(P)-dependent dehydrogenase (short-subunit alcohol dehydrogenase family)